MPRPRGLSEVTELQSGWKKGGERKWPKPKGLYSSDVKRGTEPRRIAVIDGLSSQSPVDMAW